MREREREIPRMSCRLLFLYCLQPFVNVGWPAFIGSLSGYSASPIALSQKYMPTPSNMTSRVGIPWNVRYNKYHSSDSRVIWDKVFAFHRSFVYIVSPSRSPTIR